MKFGPVPVEEAVGALAAHGVRTGDAVIKKGRPITAEDASRLKAAGVEQVVVARLEPGDVGEDEAAARLADALAGAHVEVDPAFTGRANLFSATAGVLRVDRTGIDAVNAIDEAITVATLPAFKPVVAGEMVGTVKVIPYAAGRAPLARAVAAASQAGGGVVADSDPEMEYQESCNKAEALLSAARDAMRFAAAGAVPRPEYEVAK